MASTQSDAPTDTTQPQPTDDGTKPLPPPKAPEVKKGLSLGIGSLVATLRIALGTVDLIDSLVDGPIADTVFGLVRTSLQSLLVKLAPHNEAAQALVDKHGFVDKLKLAD